MPRAGSMRWGFDDDADDYGPPYDPSDMVGGPETKARMADAIRQWQAANGLLPPTSDNDADDAGPPFDPSGVQGGPEAKGRMDDAVRQWQMANNLLPQAPATDEGDRDAAMAVSDWAVANNIVPASGGDMGAPSTASTPGVQDALRQFRTANNLLPPGEQFAGGRAADVPSDGPSYSDVITKHGGANGKGFWKRLLKNLVLARGRGARRRPGMNAPGVTVRDVPYR